MVLALAVLGLAVSAVLAWLHAKVQGGAASFCTFSEAMSCDRIAASRHSVQLGLPVAVWGVIGFSLVAGLAMSGLARRRPGSTWPAGLLLLLSGAATLLSIALAVVSKVAIGAWCPLCILAWAIALGMLAVTWRGSRVPGVRRAIAADLAEMRSRPVRVGLVGLLYLGAVALTLAAYPRYRDRGMASAPRARAAQPMTTRAAPSRDGPLVVYEYTDYECPFCARMHDRTRELAARPDLRLVRRHFPLDTSCNLAVGRQVHASACSLARAAICAEAQGRLAAMEDALFANQRDRAPVESLAVRVGLDLERFRACVASAETDRRLAADIDAGRRDGVRATPSYVVNGIVSAGKLPPDLFPSMGGMGAPANIAQQAAAGSPLGIPTDGGH